MKAIYLKLASRIGGRLPFALIGIMSVGHFLHHLQAAETKTHPKKSNTNLLLLHLTKYDCQGYILQNVYNSGHLTDGLQSLPNLFYALQLESNLFS
jgi:hypothetical protein